MKHKLSEEVQKEVFVFLLKKVLPRLMKESKKMEAGQMV